MRVFRELKVWRKGHELALAAYCETSKFPVEEKFGIINQIRRAAYSIPTNIAEGCGRGGEAELARFMQISMGSASELEYLLLLARDLNYLSKEKHDLLHTQTVEVKRMLAPFINRLREAA
jgi:four helix bundle protein